jgi:endonuclease-8
MPEGQVSHRNARRFTAALAGRSLVRIDVPEPRLAPQRIPERLAGDTVTTVDAVGKHHLFRFGSGRVLHSHLAMSGKWRIAAADRVPVPGRLWIALWTDEYVVSQYNGPRLRLYEPGEPIPAVTGVGPDLLDRSRDPSATAVRGFASVDPSTPVGVALMDQRVMSGIGNVYRSETLFLCGVDPWRTVATLGANESAALGETGSRLLAEGASRPGPIRTYRPPNPTSRERTWVYGRRGLPCRRCGTAVRSRGMGDANRTVYWCPTCQT